MKPKILLFWLVLSAKMWLVRGLMSVNKKKAFKKDLTISIGIPQSSTTMRESLTYLYIKIYSTFVFSVQDLAHVYPIFGFYGDTGR